MERYILTKYRRKGFTLLELLIVIAIIGILISVAAVSFSSAQKKSRDSRRMSDLKAIQSAFEQYYADNSAYPSSCVSPLTTYLPAGFPKDPKSGYAYNTNQADNSIGSSCSTSSYCFCVKLEGGNGNASDDACTYATGLYYCVAQLQEQQ